MRTKVVAVVDKTSTVSGPSVQHFVSMPAAPWEQSDRDRKFENIGSRVDIFGTIFPNVAKAAKDLCVDKTGLANACMFGKLDQYLKAQLRRERSGSRPYKTFTDLYQKSLEAKNSKTS